MSIWDTIYPDQRGGYLDSLTASAAPDPALPDGIANDPTLSSLLGGVDIQSLLNGPSASGSVAQPSLQEALLGSAMDVAGRYGLTGKDYRGALPPWAQNLSPEVLKNPDFDPYLGVVSQQGDERVYMGDKITHSLTPVDPANAGMAHAEPQKMGQVEVQGQTLPVAGTSDGVEFRSGGTHEAKVYTTEPKDKTKHSDKTLTTTQAMNLPYTWSEDEINSAMEKMRAAGLNVTSFDMGTNSLLNVWGALVSRAAMTYATTSGEKKVTPWDVLDLYKSEAKAAGTLGDNMPFTGNKTMVNKTVSTITDGEAWSVMQQTLARMLGRDPSDQELRDYTYRMNQMAAANPSISKTITRYKNGEAVSSSTHSDPGFTAADMAQSAYDSAQSNPEYGAFQAATTYYNAALSALGPIGG